MDHCTRNYFSSVPDTNTSAESFLSPKDKDHDQMRSPQTVDPPSFSGDVNYFTPTKTETDSKPCNDETTPIDFSSLTTADLGMTPESITKPSKGEDKSLIKKLRRRSTIGVRGSPENNSLVKYIAFQRRVKKQNIFIQPSPFKPRNTLLKDKIMAFQSSLQPLEENEKEIHLTDTFKKVNTTPHEQSKLGRACPPKCGGVALEDNINHLSTNGDRTLASIQMSTMASPSEKTLPVGTIAISEIVPVCSANSVKSGYLGCTPSKESSKTKSGLKSLHSNEELSRSDSVQNSCKKVRFAKKHRWEIFDKATLPVTPLQSHLPASSLRSSLKKTPVKTPKSMMDDYQSPVREGGIELLSNMNCEPLQKGTSTRTIDMKQGNQNLDSDASQTHLPVNIPSCRPNRLLFSPSGSTEEKSPKTPLMKQPISQPSIDDDDNNGQGTLKVALKPERATYSDLKDTMSSCLDLQATCRITRSSAKGKQISDTRKTKTKNNPKCKSSGFEKDKTIAKSTCKKKPAPRQKVFGKRRKKKKEGKALHNQRVTVSKIPLLSPITEVAEEISIVSSCRSSSVSQKSILDDSSLSLLCTESTNGKAENIVLCFDEDNCLDLLNGQDGVTGPFSQHEGDAANDIKKMLPLDPPENSCPEELKGVFHKNELVLKNDCTSNEPEVQREPEVLNLHGTDENSNAKEVFPFTIGSETDLIRMSDTVNLKRFSKRSRRLTCYGSNFEAFQSEAHQNVSDAVGNITEGLLPGANDCEFLKDLEHSIEASFSGVSRMVRRSMRQHRGTENEGLVWIQVPANNVRDQSPLGSTCKTKRRKSSFTSQETDLFHSKQINSMPVFFPMNEEQENARVGPRKSKRRRNSICVLSSKENENNLFDLTVAV